MNAGRFRERVTIQKPREVRSPSGETTLDWDDLATVYANVTQYSGRDVLQAMQVNMIISHKVTIRYLKGVTPECRILWRSRILEVGAIMDRPSAFGKFDRSHLEIMTRENQ
jgi:SPP1 family predicted phage head-tail adaptor